MEVRRVASTPGVAGIERESVAAVFLQILRDDLAVSRATGFIARGREWDWLVTCRHNLTGRDNDTGRSLSSSGAIPNGVRFWASDRTLGAWEPVEVDLYGSDEMPLWHEHPQLGAAADVVALPVHGLPGHLTHHPLSIEQPARSLRRRVTAEVFVVGYPVGYEPDSTAAPLGVWTRGSIASEPLVAVGGLPVTLVDARTRQGQSGSPVFLTAAGTVHWEDGSLQVSATEVRQLMGVYAGRTHAESDLGRVWRLEALQDVVLRGVRPTEPWGEARSPG